MNAAAILAGVAIGWAFLAITLSSFYHAGVAIDEADALIREIELEEMEYKRSKRHGP